MRFGRRQVIQSLITGAVAGLSMPVSSKTIGVGTPEIGLVRNDVEPTWNRAVDFSTLPLNCDQLLEIIHQLGRFYTEMDSGNSLAKTLYPVYKQLVAEKLAELEKVEKTTVIDPKLSDEINKQRMWAYFDLAIGIAMVATSPFFPPLAPYGALVTTVGLVSLSGKYAYQAFVVADPITEKLDFWLAVNDAKWFGLSQLTVEGRRVFEPGVRGVATASALFQAAVSGASAYRLTKASNRLDKLYELKDEASSSLVNVRQMLLQSLSSEEAFLTHLRNITPQAFQVTSTIWKALAINNCSIYREVSMNSLLRDSTTPTIGPQLF